jgi:hypothetical protein
VWRTGWLFACPQWPVVRPRGGSPCKSGIGQRRQRLVTFRTTSLRGPNLWVLRASRPAAGSAEHVSLKRECEDESRAGGACGPDLGPHLKVSVSGQQTGSNRPPWGPTRYLEKRGRSSDSSGTDTFAHLRLFDDPSRSLTIRRSGRHTLVGSDTEEVTGSNPVAPTNKALTSGNASPRRYLTGSRGHGADGTEPHSGQEHFTG